MVSRWNLIALFVLNYSNDRCVHADAGFFTERRQQQILSSDSDTRGGASAVEKEEASHDAARECYFEIACTNPELEQSTPSNDKFVCS